MKKFRALAFAFAFAVSLVLGVGLSAQAAGPIVFPAGPGTVALVDPTSLSITGTASFLDQTDGTASALSPAAHSRLIYNNTTKTLQASVDGGAYTTIGGAGGTLPVSAGGDTRIDRSSAGVCKFTDTGVAIYSVVGQGGIAVRSGDVFAFSSSATDASAAAAMNFTSPSATSIRLTGTASPLMQFGSGADLAIGRSAAGIFRVTDGGTTNIYDVIGLGGIGVRSGDVLAFSTSATDASAAASMKFSRPTTAAVRLDGTTNPMLQLGSDTGIARDGFSGAIILTDGGTTNIYALIGNDNTGKGVVEVTSTGRYAWSNSATDGQTTQAGCISSPSAGNFSFDTTAAGNKLGSWSATSGTLSGTLSLTGAAPSINTYANVATAGWGVPAIYAANGTTGSTGAVASIAAYTVGAASGDFEVSVNLDVTTSTTHSFDMRCAYTNENNVAQVMVFPLNQLSGSFITLATNVTGTGSYGSPIMHIRAKNGTAITLRTMTVGEGGVYTTVTFSTSGVIRQAR